ncbi:unnamed protein product [Sphenostylis stenocarpa]|uniref:Uncharacterized protein n=1 Tax=Sphenostylis stenocarpa TaxID=92480 RepID=A0AA86VDJ4_9FABA|nr:unnamed protein product [Sphenostylis stenocarpa]
MQPNPPRADSYSWASVHLSHLPLPRLHFHLEAQRGKAHMIDVDLNSQFEVMNTGIHVMVNRICSAMSSSAEIPMYHVL